MGDYQKICLTGGVFFGLLTEIKYESGTTEYENPYYESVTDPILMAELIKVVTGEKPDPKAGGFSKDVSKYRNCIFNGGKNVPFNDKAFLSTFNHAMTNNYPELLNRMTQFTYSCLNPLEPTKKEYLVKQILRLIELDESIKDYPIFRINSDGSCVSKTKIQDNNNYNFQAFLLGIFHYAINNQHDNEDGQYTYSLLFPASESHIEGKYESTALGDLSNINVTLSFNTLKNKNLISQASISDEEITAYSLAESMDLLVEEKLRDFAHQYGQEYEGDMDCVHHYLYKAKDYYSSVKTLLYSEKPRRFWEFYVCNNLYKKAHGLGTTSETISDATVDSLKKVSMYCIISGTGGIGKSMMMRHLFFHSAEDFTQTDYLPILVSLKDYNPDACSLVDFFLDSIKDFDERFTLNHLRHFLNNKKTILLLDGLDEIPTSQKDGFENALKKFMKQYGENQIIMSSRPYNSFVQYTHFTVVEIQPFTKPQSLLLIDKLDFHDPIAKKKFREDLDSNLFYSHMEFASNPLLLTIMLMTYTTYGDIPAKRHVFYAKAYETMSRLHDASKGAYVRPMQTNLSPEDFASFFSEFCARTYKEELIEFTDITFNNYMDKTIMHQRINTNAKSADFMADLTKNLCIMYKEGEKIFFFHRSFQEYFTALFFSRCMDDSLSKVGVFFESQKNRQRGDITFDMLYDMIPEETERYILLPFLKEQYKHFDANNGYWTFLEEIYPTLFAADGEVNDYYDNEPESFLFGFIVKKSGNAGRTELYNLSWPSDIHDFEEKEWYEISEYEPQSQDSPGYYHTTVVEYDELPSRYKYDYEDEYGFYDYEEPTQVGSSWEIDVTDILQNKDKYSDLITFMENDNFPFKIIYNNIRKDMEILDERFNKKSDTGDWFDDF